MIRKNSHTSFLIKLLLPLMMFFLVSNFAYADTVSSMWGLQQKVNATLAAHQTKCLIKYTGKSMPSKYQIMTILKSAINADDYTHYIMNTYAYNSSGYSGNYNVTFTFTYNETPSQTAVVDAKVKAVLIQLGIDKMNEYQKEKAIHDWIVSHVAYDTTYTKNTAYAAIVWPYKTVCQGYSLLTYKMFKAAGLSTRIISGYSMGQAHSWNLVKVDGRWYHVDLTWDDPVPDVSGRVLYDYYNITDDEIKINHSWTGIYPVASSEFSDILKLKIVNDSARKAIYENLIKEISADCIEAESSYEVKELIKNAINNGKTEVVFRLANKDDMASYINEAMNELEINISYSYTYSDYIRTINPDDILVEIEFKSVK